MADFRILAESYKSPHIVFAQFEIPNPKPQQGSLTTRERQLLENQNVRYVPTVNFYLKGEIVLQIRGGAQTDLLAAAVEASTGTYVFFGWKRSQKKLAECIYTLRYTRHATAQQCGKCGMINALAYIQGVGNFRQRLRS
jgi:hypothetical protein